LTVLFRVILAIPHFFWLWAFTVVAVFAVLANWLAALVTGRPPARLHALLARYARYTTHISAYVFLVANPYPRFLGKPGSYPVDLELPGPAPQNRWVTAFRLVLAVPALVLAYVFGTMLLVVALVGWFVSLAIGRMPKGMRDLSAYCLRYRAQTLAYVILLTSRYPTLYAVPV
jgi:hypothetical protein